MKRIRKASGLFRRSRPHAPYSTQSRDQLHGLLAVIHRDGGHYQASFGLDKALADAKAISIFRFRRIAEQNEMILKLSEKLLICAENLARCAEKRR